MKDDILKTVLLMRGKKTFNIIKEKILSLQEDGRNSDKNLIYPLLKMFVKVLKM